MRFTALVLLLALTGTATAAPCSRRSFEASMFTVCPFDAKRQELRLVTTPSRGFAGLSSERVSFGINAGMFDESGAPVGLLVEDGRTVHNLNTARGSGNFYMQPNGVFSQDQDGRLHVETTQAFAARHPKPRWAMQSGPMLLIAGKLHPLISDDGPSRYVRNGVCLKVPERALFAISEGAVSFGRFAHSAMRLAAGTRSTSTDSCRASGCRHRAAWTIARPSVL